jgi:hypothetical protein
MRLLLPLIILVAQAFCQETRAVVVATTRAGQVEMFDADWLAPLGSIRIHKNAESVSASPDGRTLYIAQDKSTDSAGCCSLFSLDLETRRMCVVTSSAMFGVPSPDGRYLFTQHNDAAIDVFDARTLLPRTTIKAPGVYNLQASPDGRWLFGITNWPSPSLDVFDLNSRTLARRIPVPTSQATGAWAGGTFYLFGYGERLGELWEVRPDVTELTSPKPIDLPDLHGGCQEPLPLAVAASPGRFYLAEAFGYKVDRRRGCSEQPQGGIFRIDPASGHAEYFAPHIYVKRMFAGPRGGDLYVIDSAAPDDQGRDRLIRLGAANRSVQELPPGVWNVAIVNIPAGLIPQGHVRAQACAH